MNEAQAKVIDLQEELRASKEEIELLRQCVSNLEEELDWTRENARKELSDQLNDLSRVINSKDARLTEERKNFEEQMLQFQADQLGTVEKIVALQTENDLLRQKINRAQREADAKIERLQQDLETAIKERDVYLHKYLRRGSDPTEIRGLIPPALGTVITVPEATLRNENSSLAERSRHLEGIIADISEALNSLEGEPEASGAFSVSARFSSGEESSLRDEVLARLKYNENTISRQQMYIKRLLERVIRTNPDLLENLWDGSS